MLPVYFVFLNWEYYIVFILFNNPVLIIGL